MRYNLYQRCIRLGIKILSAWKVDSCTGRRNKTGHKILVEKQQHTQKLHKERFILKSDFKIWNCFLEFFDVSIYPGVCHNLMMTIAQEIEDPKCQLPSAQSCNIL